MESSGNSGYRRRGSELGTEPVTALAITTSDFKTNSQQLAITTSDFRTNSQQLAITTSDLKTNSQQLAITTCDVKTRKIVYFQGLRTCRLALYPRQMDLLHRSPPRVFLTGPPGTGKTVILVLQGAQWLQDGKIVNVVSTRNESRAGV